MAQEEEQVTEEVAEQSDETLDDYREQREDERKAFEERAEEVFGKLQYEKLLNKNKLISTSPAQNTDNDETDEITLGSPQKVRKIH